MKLSRCLLAWAVAAIAVTCSSAMAVSRPNIIFILADDLGWTDLGCYGSRFYRTPHLDRLASEGIKFSDAYAAAPVCSPTRAAVLTGQYPARLQLTDWIPGKASLPREELLGAKSRQELSLDATTLPELLKKSGYITACIGKWHLGGKGFEPEQQGFNMSIASSAAGSPASYFSPYKSPKRTTPLSPGNPGEYLTDRLTDEALTFIEENKAHPFFLYLPHFAVHTPIQGKTNLVEKYQKLSQPDAPHRDPVYAAMIESLDDSVGRIMQKLDELHIADDTILFFTSDNGGLTSPRVTSNEPLRTGKGYVYEGGIRVPLIVRWKGTIKPGQSGTPVSSIDYLPTILDLTGIAADRPVPLDGESLKPILSGSGALKRQELYWHYPHYSPQGGAPGGVVRQGDFKLIQFFEDGRLELYNLREDIGETKDLSGENPAKTMELVNRLDMWRRNVHAQMMLSNPKFRPE